MSALKPVYGVGTNDAGHPVRRYENVDGAYRRLWQCAFYRTWADMLKRCYSEKFQAATPSYRGCAVIDEWLVFSSFRDWMASQDHEGKQLDKDLLIPGNKLYSPETCCFLSHQLNSFLNDGGSWRGGWPKGVHFHARSGLFRAKCNDPFSNSRRWLGEFKCAQEAHVAWRQCKHELACKYAEQQTDQRIAEALRTRYAQPQPARSER